MVLSDPLPARVHALVGFGMNSPNARRLVSFYEQALGARVQRRARWDPHRFVRWAGIRGGAESTLLRVGESAIELFEFDHPGRPYPQELSPFDTRFQHLGIVVSDMQAAVEHLAQTAGWTAISEGPQRLPNAAGGVTAFKFRDPDGHPLEFLQFAAGNTPPHWRDTTSSAVHLGIDHSALSVADASRSVHYYESLGLTVSNRSLNQGIEQERLDGVTAPRVDVIALAPPRPTPHVELLHYHTTVRPLHDVPAGNDDAAIRLIFTAGHAGADATDAKDPGDPGDPGEPNEPGDALIQDPDGHFLQLTWQTASTLCPSGSSTNAP
jgi:catechol 2,3-dioxygenase-like lactoylglutathione lyase family enzyme